ncbi:class A beta-lactamase-related serine hydrolase [Oscillatoria sp. CS-180]|uniref:serine hydrolase n=1 Tax=Oscillatoria sp. CS-180 TaxID=3021720 RepID=UPI00232D36E3|nr:serine hydrolase [Oscillatoria sp. CS-180]MDB9525726.1 class A beta-lactamase-related serine hydrolase [Oscillatoria sp. CS-180]
MGFLSGIAVTVAIGSLRPTFTDLWSQRPPGLNLGSSGSDAFLTDGDSDIASNGLTTLEVNGGMGDLAPYFAVIQAARMTREQVQMEAAAEANFKRSKELAVQGIATRDAGREDGEETLEELLQQEYLWQSALRQLEQIPEESVLAEAATARREDYAAILGPVSQDIDKLQSGFLSNIAEATGRPQAIRITICHLSGECRDYRGDQPPASPASLIKLPVAVVLMQKVMEEGIDLSDSMYVDPHNWTENANGAKIYVRHEYPIREVMVRMLKESNNIATNQLIDYIGWDYMNETLQKMGYEQTRVRSKLIGDRTAPTRNRSVGRNVMTSNEVTEMMRQIYTFSNPGDDEILEGMVGQYDWEFGYTAVSQLRDKRVAWIGEKTGQNSNVIGSSTAVKIDDERYVLTVTIDNSANQRMLREVMGNTIQHILDEGHLVRVSR